VISLLLIGVLSAIAAAANAIAGGGTLLTFPALIGLGIPPIVANATSTVALWPGSMSSMFGYRRALQDVRPWAVAFAIPSVLGGAVGAFLLVVTPAARFDRIVPFLVFGATLLFLTQGPIIRFVARARGAPPSAKPSWWFVVAQFAVAIYGGYFGAVAGIVMLASLGLMGLTDIHQMNGLKNWGAICFNGVAVVIFIASGLVNWPVALVMAVGALLGGWTGSKLAQRMPREHVRTVIGVIGLAAAGWLFVR
jgi:uncharacterized membrane protein YfcA